jgi:hypothetical protein
LIVVLLIATCRLNVADVSFMIANGGHAGFWHSRCAVQITKYDASRACISPMFDPVIVAA